MTIADRIGNRMAFETYLVARTQTCLTNLENYFMNTLSNNMNLLPTAESQVDTKLAELKEVIGNLMESDDAFRARME
jgi:septin family protein